MSPPNVLDAPKPTSSSKIKTMLGASAGALTGSGQYSFDSDNVRPTTP